MNNPRARLVEVRLQNYRALESVQLVLDPVTYVLGHNGAGKSSLLDAMVFLRDAVTDGLRNALDRRGGLERVRRRSARPDAPLGLALRFELEFPGRPSQSVLYGIRLGGADPAAIEEIVASTSDGVDKFHRVDTNFESNREWNPVVPRESLVLPLIAGATSIWTAIDTSLKQLRTYDLMPERIAQATQVGPGLALDRDGGNAADVAHVVLQDPRARDDIRDTLRVLHPGLEGVRTRLDLGRRSLVFDVAEDEIREYGAHEVSHGLLRSLGMMLALYQPLEPSLLMMDEVENSIHPAALPALAESLALRARQFPVVLTSHSPELLGLGVEPGQVRLVSWERGVSRISPLSAATLASVDPVTNLGDLFRQNALFVAAEPFALRGDLFQLPS